MSPVLRHTRLLVPVVAVLLVFAATAVAGASTSTTSSSSASVVQIGSSGFPVLGTNVYRAADSLVVYDSGAGKTTPTNIWGAEAVVLGGVVTALVDRQSTRGSAVKIPANGYVLSGHGRARDWLLAHARPGATVMRCWEQTCLGTSRTVTAVTIGSATHPLSGVDIYRDTDTLVAYTPGSYDVTPTNMWGAEAVVVGGVVKALVDRQATRSTMGTPVPGDGLVLSGHGRAGDWLRAHARVGALVKGVEHLAGESETSTPTSSPTATPSPTATATPSPTATATPSPTATATPSPTATATPSPTPTTSTAPSPSPSPTASPTETAPASGTTGTAPMPYPAKAVGVYHMMWSTSKSPRLADLPANVNVVKLAFAQGDPPRLVGWGRQTEAEFLADAKTLRARGVRIVLSVGGAHGSVNIANRQAFVDSVMALNSKLPLDGLDWDIEGSTPMPADDVLAISASLKQLRGKDFAITMAPNGSNIDHYRSIAVKLHAQGNLDMIGQQFYDAVVSYSAALGRVDQLVAAGIPTSKIGIGMMVGNEDVYWTVDECIAAVKHIKAKHPGIRGGYLWEHGRSGTGDWASRVGPLLTS